ncbi:hypothetical protein WG904_05155 [Pedobacter sp. Du54]|uniref:hypothetical protein n=1 Tax=Pedobacter anseongensis TaxID=3133439 RepID=UPI0030A5D2EF
MNGIGKLLIRVFYLNIACLSIAHAQTPKLDSALNTPIEKAEWFFNAHIKQQSRLFNGPSFKNYGASVVGSANFEDDSTFVMGNVIYENIPFNNIPLMYNIYEDKVISLLNTSTMFSLISQKVSDFYLKNHHFKYINVIDTTKSVIKPGFFDVLYDGRLKILAKRMKKLQLTLNSKEVGYYFVPKTTYYLENGTKYAVISNESSFMNLFKAQKNEFKKHLKDNKINFKKKPEEAMILLAKYYESSSH